MTIKDLRTKTPEQLTKHVQTLKAEIGEIIREKRTNAGTNVRKLGNLKREIARSMTVINEQKQDNNDVKENA